MFIKEIEVENFRNIKSLKLVPSPKINFLIGDNGQGKSNLLEAIYGDIRGKSFRTYAQRKDWIPEGSLSGTRVSLITENDRGFETELSMRLENNKNLIWKFYLNQKAAQLKTRNTRVSVVVFSPDDHELIRGPAEKRREFLDDLLSDICPGYFEVLGRFEKCLRERNKVLRQIKKNFEYLKESPSSFWTSELETWSQMLAKESLALVQLRLEFWPQFDKRFSRVAMERGGFGNQTVKAYYVTDPLGQVSTHHLVPQEHHFYNSLKDSLETDIATGWTHRGPHRDDLNIVFGDLEGKRQSSQGQARILAFLLKWMHAEWVKEAQNEHPILLLDDFSSELDTFRRTQLLELITQSKGQVFLTATELLSVDFGALSEYTYFKVHSGQFHEEKP